MTQNYPAILEELVLDRFNFATPEDRLNYLAYLGHCASSQTGKAEAFSFYSDESGAGKTTAQAIGQLISEYDPHANDSVQGIGFAPGEAGTLRIAENLVMTQGGGILRAHIPATPAKRSRVNHELERLIDSEDYSERFRIPSGLWELALRNITITLEFEGSPMVTEDLARRSIPIKLLPFDGAADDSFLGHITEARHEIHVAAHSLEHVPALTGLA